MPDDLDREHTLTVTMKFASAPAAYDALNNMSRAFKVIPEITSDDFDDDNTIIPVGTAVPLVTQSKTNPQAVGSAVVNPA